MPICIWKVENFQRACTAARLTVAPERKTAAPENKPRGVILFNAVVRIKLQRLREAGEMEMNVATEADRREISNIEIQEKNGYKGVFAKEDMEMNSVIKLEGVISEQQSRYSIQLGKNKHLNLPAGVNGNIDNPDFFWTYLNHSCQPNGYIDTAELTFRALRKISRGEECTFNYLTTEYEMAAPFICQCGAAGCFGLIQGHKHLSAEQRAELVVLQE